MSAKQTKKGKKEPTKEASKEQVKEAVKEPVKAAVPVEKKVEESKKTVVKKAPVKKAETEQKSEASTPASVPTKKAGTSVKKAESKPKAVKATKKAPVKKAGGAKKEKAPVEPTEKKNNSRTRYFKVLVDGEEAHGRFCGAKPKQAANKALTSLSKTLEQVGGGSGKVKFTIVECTRGSKHKKYRYIGERVKLDVPMKVKIGNGPNAKEIEYNYTNRVMKDKSVEGTA